MGLTELSSGSVRVCGAPPRRGSNVIGYIPQQKAFDRDLPLRVGDGEIGGIGQVEQRLARLDMHAGHDLDDAGRVEAFAVTAKLRALEAALDPDGLSTTARAVLARIEAASRP